MTHAARCLLFLAFGLQAHGAWAEPRFAQMYKQQAGYMPSCNACHTDGGGSDLNSYGEAFKAAGHNLAAFSAITTQDADADGHSNGEEIAAKANPGDAKSIPANTGDWLDTANLIPRPIQKLFPGVTLYKPLDAILTDKEISQAAAMGATLGQQDQTTIYIPVKQRKPVGTAVIMPARYQDQQFFVILATDRQLKVTQARPMHASTVQGVEQSQAFTRVVGLSVDALPAGDDSSLDQAILAGLKRAGTLLYVRLKGQ